MNVSAAKLAKTIAIGSLPTTAACAELTGQPVNYFAPVSYEKQTALKSKDKTPTRVSRLEAGDDGQRTTAKATSNTSKPKPVQMASRTDPASASQVRYSGGAGGGTSGSSQLGGIGVGSIAGSPTSGTSTLSKVANNVVSTAKDVTKTAATTVTNTANKAVSAAKKIKIKKPFK